MKRLLCIVGSMNAGGAETLLMKIYRQLDRSKYQMDFAVAVSEEGIYDREIKSYGGRIYHISPKSAGLVKNFNDIKKLVHKEQYESVLRVSQHSLSALELLAAWMGGAKIRGFRSSNSNTTTGGGMDLKLHKLCMFMPRLFANVRIAPSTEAAEFMFGKGCIKKGKAVLLHNAVDVDYFSYKETGRQKIREEFHIEDKFVVGHIGRFNQQKNHSFLLDVFAEVVKQLDDAVLMLVGKGELEQNIKEKAMQLGIQDKVIFTGIRQDIPDLLSAMDIFVFPSLYEGMPNTVIEAQANGLKCIVADTITREADISGLVEYLPLDIKTWVDAICKGKSMHQNQKANFEANKYDIQSITKEFVQMLIKG